MGCTAQEALRGYWFDGTEPTGIRTPFPGGTGAWSGEGGKHISKGQQQTKDI